MSEVELCPWCGTEISRTKFEQIEEKIRAEEQRKTLAHETQIKKKLEDEYKSRLADESKKAAEAATALAEKVLKPQLAEQARAIQAAQEIETTLKSQLEAQKKAQEAELQKAVNAQLTEQRTILAHQSEKDLAKKDSDHKREMEKMQAQLTDMAKRLEKKTANELGEGPEIDLFDSLREHFPEDQIVRIKKGQPGADIRQNVLHHNQDCGLVLFDSKNHKAWRNDFVTKLRQDQVDALRPTTQFSRRWSFPALKRTSVSLME